jgi:hypothetical protein
LPPCTLQIVTLQEFEVPYAIKNYNSKLWHNPKALFGLPLCILQIVTLQEFEVPYAFTDISQFAQWLSHKEIFVNL